MVAVDAGVAMVVVGAVVGVDVAVAVVAGVEDVEDVVVVVAVAALAAEDVAEGVAVA